MALRLLERTNGRYANTAETDFYLDRSKPSYIGGMAEMQSVSGYRVWASLTGAPEPGNRRPTPRAISGASTTTPPVLAAICRP